VVSLVLLFVLAMLFGLLVVLKHFHGLENFAAGDALPLGGDGHAQIRVGKHRAFFFEKLLGNGFELRNLTLLVVNMEVSGAVQLVTCDVSELQTARSTDDFLLFLWKLFSR